MKDILYFLNPYAKEGEAKKLWTKARKKYPMLPKDPVDITTVDVPTYLAKHNPKVIAIAGGDGTINVVCTAVRKMKRKPLLAILPLGFGNALSYCLGVETIDKAIDVLTKQEKKITVDLMQTSIPGHDTGVFSVSVGLSARILMQRLNYRYIGYGSYLLSILQSVFSHSENEITFTIDHKVTLSAKASQLIIANCPVIGLNYVVAPKARLNDGFLDCTLFSTKFASLTGLRLQGFKHPLYSELGKVRFKAKHIKIEGEPFVQIDGDPMIKKDKIEVEIIPAQVTFLRNTKENINQDYLPFLT